MPSLQASAWPVMPPPLTRIPDVDPIPGAGLDQRSEGQLPLFFVVEEVFQGAAVDLDLAFPRPDADPGHRRLPPARPQGNPRGLGGGNHRRV